MRKLLSWIGRPSARAPRGEAMAPARARRAARRREEVIMRGSGERLLGKWARLVMRVILNIGSQDTWSHRAQATHCESLSPDVDQENERPRRYKMIGINRLDPSHRRLHIVGFTSSAIALFSRSRDPCASLRNLRSSTPERAARELDDPALRERADAVPG